MNLDTVDGHKNSIKSPLSFNLDGITAAASLVGVVAQHHLHYDSLSRVFLRVLRC